MTRLLLFAEAYIVLVILDLDSLLCWCTSRFVEKIHKMEIKLIQKNSLPSPMANKVKKRKMFTASLDVSFNTAEYCDLTVFHSFIVCVTL